ELLSWLVRLEGSLSLMVWLPSPVPRRVCPGAEPKLLPCYSVTRGPTPGSDSAGKSGLLASIPSQARAPPNQALARTTMMISQRSGIGPEREPYRWGISTGVIIAPQPPTMFAKPPTVPAKRPPMSAETAQSTGTAMSLMKQAKDNSVTAPAALLTR